MRILNSVILWVIPVALLTSCDTTNDTFGGVSTITYTTNNTFSPGKIQFPNTGISLNASMTYATWACPAGYVPPTKLAKNTPTTQTRTEMTCNLAGGCNDRQVEIIYEPNPPKWYTVKDLVDKKAYKYMMNVMNYANQFQNFICVPVSEKDGWI